MNESEIKKLLEDFTKEKLRVEFSKHFHKKAVMRGINQDDVLKKLGKPEDLLSAEDQGGEPKGHKYALLFKYMSNYDFKIVVSVKGSILNIVTAHIINKKRRDRYIKWSESQK